jgi:GNAT superfamily N-acetyltransferase
VGTAPASQDERWHRVIGGLIERRELLVARDDNGTTLGSIALADHPPLHYRHVWDDRPGNAGYIEAFVTHRHLGLGVGAQLLTWAEERFREEGRELSRLDCSAADPGLRAYYERQGFTALGSAPVGTATIWLLEKPL